jgi:hypothetical protein
MRWSWRLALERFGVAAVGLNLLLFLVFAVASVVVLFAEGWHAASRMQEGGWYLTGLFAGAVAGGWGCLRAWPKGRVFAVAMLCAAISCGGQIGALAGNWDFSKFVAVVLELAIAAFVGVFGGFVSGMIDPTRSRRSGVWFWLRVPLLAFTVVGALMTIPGFVYMVVGDSPTIRASQQSGLLGAMVFGAGAGLVAFFRFGGFNGLQHGVLRWLLVRGGVLPPKAESFFDHTSQRALLQKVGFGYRFIHALLLDHFADMRPGLDSARRPVAKE